MQQRNRPISAGTHQNLMVSQMLKFRHSSEVTLLNYLNGIDMFRLVRQIHDVSDPLISGLEIVYVDSHQVIIKTEKNFDTVENHLSVPFALIGITGNEIILRTNEAIISLNARSA